MDFQWENNLDYRWCNLPDLQGELKKNLDSLNPFKEELLQDRVAIAYPFRPKPKETINGSCRQNWDSAKEGWQFQIAIKPSRKEKEREEEEENGMKIMENRDANNHVCNESIDVNRYSERLGLVEQWAEKNEATFIIPQRVCARIWSGVEELVNSSGSWPEGCRFKSCPRLQNGMDRKEKGIGLLWMGNSSTHRRGRRFSLNGENRPSKCRDPIRKESWRCSIDNGNLIRKERRELIRKD